MSDFQVYIPGTMAELIEDLKKITPKSKILSGGTDLVLAIREGRVGPDAVVDISNIVEMKHIKEEKGSIWIGAGATFTEISRNSLINKYARCLSEASGMMGSQQIRNRATIGGNIANASPAGDSIPPLIAMDASLSIVNSRGDRRELPVRDVLADAGKNTLNFDEVITEIKLPAPARTRMPEKKFISAFVKLGTRSTVSIARLSMAVNLVYDANSQRIEEAGVVLGAIGKTAFRAVSAEQVLLGRELTGELAEVFAKTLAAEVEKAIPGRYSLPYKKEAVKGIAYEVFEKLVSMHDN